MWPASLRFECILHLWRQEFSTAILCDERKQIPSNRENWSRYKKCKGKPYDEVSICCKPGPSSSSNHRDDQKEARSFTRRRHATMIDSRSEQFVHEAHDLTNAISFLKNCFGVSERLLVAVMTADPAMMSARSRLLFP